MIYALGGTVLLCLVYLPSLWVTHVLKRYSRELPDIRGTGGELAKHLLARFDMGQVTVEVTDPGSDHYDPQSKAVRLGPDNYHGKSLTAVAVAAHEVGHAIQFHRQEPLSKLRGRYIPAAILLKRLGALIILLVPVILSLFHVPMLGILTVVAGIVVQLISALMYVIILPEEWDASFQKALPILVEGGYVDESQMIPIRRILKAAALTYLAGALADILRLWRYIAILRGLR